MNLPKLSGLLAAAQRAAFRFPLAFFSAILGTAALCWMVDAHDDGVEKNCLRLAMAASIGLALFTALTVFSEKKGHSAQQKWLFQLLGLAIVAGLWWSFDLSTSYFSEKTSVRFGLWALIAHLLVSFAAFTEKGARLEDFWEFNKQLFSVFIVGVLYSVVIWGGVAIAFAAADALFEAVSIRGETYARLFFVVAGFFQTSFVLSNFPRDFDFSSDEIRFDRSVVNLVKFILIPIVGLYFLILYAYSGKIVALWSLPKGWVTSLVIGFSASGIFTWLMNFYLPRVDASPILAFFKKWFWAILAPMLGLLFFAVGRRLADYGVTEARFVGATTGVWLGAMAAYFLFSKSKDLRAIPVSMAAFAGLCLMPFLGMFDASTRSQTSQFFEILSKNGLFDGQKLIKTEKLISGEDATRAADILQFLRKRHGLASVQKLLPTEPDSLFSSNSTDYFDWQMPTDLAKKLGFDATNLQPDGTESRYFSTASSSPRIAVAGFDEVVPLQIYSYAELADHADLAVWLAEDGKSLVLRSEKGDSSRFDLEPFLQKIWLGTEKHDVLQPAESQFELSPKARLIVESVNAQRDSTGVRVTNLNGWLLLKK